MKKAEAEYMTNTSKKGEKEKEKKVSLKEELVRKFFNEVSRIPAD